MDINFLKSKSVHIIGINGIGMSALAIYLKNKEIKVSGSDITENSNTKVLNKSPPKHKSLTLVVLGKDIIFYVQQLKIILKLLMLSMKKMFKIICKLFVKIISLLL